MVTRMFRGEVPSPEYLAVICAAENINLNWLILNRGPVFLVHHSYSDGQTARLLDAFVGDSPMSWNAYVIRDEARLALALHRSNQTELKGEIIDYDQVELVVGVIGSLSFDVLRRHGVLQIREIAVPVATMDRLIGGEVGTFELIREDGLLERYKPLDLKDGFDFGESATGHPMEPDELALLERYRRLTPDDKARLVAIGEALGEVERQEPESQ